MEIFMKDIDVRNISQSIENEIDKIEKEIGYKVLFGAVGGSYSLGLQNTSSDIDFYLVVDSDQLMDVIDKKMYVSIQEKLVLVDFICVAYQEILSEIEKYRNMQRRYPTVSYRTEEEKKNNVCKRDIDRPDFKRSILFRIFLSDKVIQKGLAQMKFADFQNGMNIADIIDYHYTRIYGNYNEKIKDKDFIPIRKYLYTIHEICTCEYLMHNIGKPPMNMIGLINSTLTDVSLKDRIYQMYEKNKYAIKSKKEELTYKDELLNQFILKSMAEIEDCLENGKYMGEFLCI